MVECQGPGIEGNAVGRAWDLQLCDDEEMISERVSDGFFKIVTVPDMASGGFQ
jgi:hypothetical protein